MLGIQLTRPQQDYEVQICNGATTKVKMLAATLLSLRVFCLFLDTGQYRGHSLVYQKFKPNPTWTSAWKQVQSSVWHSYCSPRLTEFNVNTLSVLNLALPDLSSPLSLVIDDQWIILNMFSGEVLLMTTLYVHFHFACFSPTLAAHHVTVDFASLVG